MKTILVTGASGQLGSALRNIAANSKDATFLFTDVDTLDICNWQQVADFFKNNRIDAAVNCAAYTAVDRAEDDAGQCALVNRDAVRNIGEAAVATGAKVIHISTDYVFDGRATRPYREDDPACPSSVYGSTKLAGEQALTAVCSDAVIIRTAWLYFETGNNFVRTMLRTGAERGQANVVADQTGAPTYAGDLAEAITAILAAGNFTPGVYHYANEGVCTWYDFAVRIFEKAAVRCTVKPVTTAEYPTRAARPAYSVLDKTKIRETYGISIPRWEDSLDKCLLRMKS